MSVVNRMARSARRRRTAAPLTSGDEGWLLELHVRQGLLVVEHAGVEDAGSSPVALV